MSNPAPSLHDTWNAVIDELNQRSNDPKYSLGRLPMAYLALSRPIGLLENVAVIALPSERAKKAVEGKVLDNIREVLSAMLGRDFSIALTIDPSLQQHPEDAARQRNVGEQMAMGFDANEPAAHQAVHPTPNRALHSVEPVSEASTEPAQTGQPTQPAQPSQTAQNQQANPFAESLSDAFGTYSPQAPSLHNAADHGPYAELASDMPQAQQGDHAHNFQRPNAQHLAGQQPSAQQEHPGGGQQAPSPTSGWSTSHAQEPPHTPVGRRQREKPAHDPNGSASLNERFTFDNYVVSDSNRLPYSAAIAVAEKPAQAYNPLFIWGDSGLGKTHLMHAIGNYAQVLDPRLRIKYVSSEEFTNDYINSVRDDRQERFKRRYRDVEILMVDDIQFLQGKEGTQEEFFHTFNALEQANKQIVLSSDRPPQQLTTLEDRLRTRFQSGLIVDVYPPDLETRIAILMKKSRTLGTEVSHEVLEMIASRFNTSIRELEGAFVRVTAYASINNKRLDAETAQTALRDMMPDQACAEITPEAIIEVTADFFKITPADVKGDRKTRAIAHARQLAMYLCRELTELSLPKIGEQFGGKDHTTVMYADRKIRKEISEKRDTYDQIQQLTQRIKSQS